MKVDLSSLSLGEASGFETSYDGEKLDLNTQDIEFLEPILFKGTLDKEEGVLVVKGEASWRWRETCSRCLAMHERTQKLEIMLDLLIKPDQKEYDFTPEIREEVLLSCPVKLLCNENCKGLCSNCGTNLNVGPCDCRQETNSVSPFQILKKFKKDKNNA